MYKKIYTYKQIFAYISIIYHFISKVKFYFKEAIMSATTAFLEGLLSFFSPCVLPMLPLYFGYLTVPKKGKTILHTLCFVAGSSTAIMLLGAGATALGGLFTEYADTFARVGGVIILLLGLFQLGFLKLPSLNRERKVGSVDVTEMSPLTALAMGFFFSFGWTPCVGPMLGSIVILSAVSGRLALIAIYTAGFAIPFLIVGLFSEKLLSFLKKRPEIGIWASRIGGALIVVVGLTMLIGGGVPDMGIEQILPSTEQGQTDDVNDTDDPVEDSVDPSVIMAPDFTYTDQHGTTHSLSDKVGKPVFINYWATWCGYCVEEMPAIESVYNKYKDEVEFLAIAQDYEDPFAYAEDNGYTFPVAIDIDDYVAQTYGVRAYPTTFIIYPDGSIMGYVEGAMDEARMTEIIEMALEGNQG